jgi:hypothetical protein
MTQGATLVTIKRRRLCTAVLGKREEQTRMAKRCNHVGVIRSGEGCRYAMAPKGVGYRKTNTLRGVPRRGFTDYDLEGGI